MVSIDPAIAAACGWYTDGERLVLLTQFAEDYFGEPMVLLAENDRVQRLDPQGEAGLTADDGTVITILPDALQLTVENGQSRLDRSAAWPETQVRFLDLAGTLITPAGPGPHPAAVVVHGAAGGQRDFMRLFARPLLEAGVAVLIYDKPGHGQSGGGPDPSIFDQAQAASAAVDLLGARPEIDSRRIGLAGFSNGMWAVPMVAARRTDIAFVCGVGSPGVSMADSEVHRRTKVLREAGVGEATFAAAGRAWATIFAIVAGGSTPQLERDLDQALTTLMAAEDLGRYEVPAFAQANPMLSPIPPLAPAAELIAMIGGERDPQLTHDPAEDYGRSHCAIYLQYGSQDTSVPVDASVARVRAAAGDRAEIVVYPGLEHMLNVVPEVGATEEAMYQFHDFRFGAGVHADLTNWLRRNVIG